MEALPEFGGIMIKLSYRILMIEYALARLRELLFASRARGSTVSAILTV